MKGMILAAGEGSRLRPHTLHVPKPMLPVAGTPTLEWIVRWMSEHHVDDIVINLHYKPAPVIAHFGDGRDLGVSITYSVENEILGTAGGVKRAAALFDEAFVVVYGDVLTDMDLSSLVAFHRAVSAGPHVTLSVYEASNPWDCGVVAVDDNNRVARFVEKPARHEVFSRLTNSGVLVIDPPILGRIEHGYSDFGRDVLPRLMNEGVEVFARQIEPGEYLLDIGTPANYARAQLEWPTATARRCA